MSDSVNIKVQHGDIDNLEKQLLDNDKIVEVEGEFYGSMVVSERMNPLNSDFDIDMYFKTVKLVKEQNN